VGGGGRGRGGEQGRGGKKEGKWGCGRGVVEGGKGEYKRERGWGGRGGAGGREGWEK